MKRAASPADSSATKVRKCEVNPDLPLNISDIEDVQALVRANNAETRPKRRLKQLEFLNYAFSTLSLEALKDSAKVEVVQKLHGEFVSKHRCLPRNTVLSKVLYAWNNADLSEAAVSLVRAVMDAQDELPDAFRAAMDERVVTVMLRVLVKAPSIDYQLIDALLEHLPQEAYKRRVFSPLLQHGRDAMDIRFTMKVFERAQRCEIELWDEDYHHVLRCIEACHTSGSCSNADAAMYVEATLSVMESHHPVLGKSNCEIIQGLLGGLDSSIDGAGKCSRCAEQLRSFDLGDADRKNLLDDIENKLVAPRVRGLSHYDPEQTVSAVEEERRWAEFRHFQSQVRVMDYDTLIDGANVGYYGLSSWYQEEKERQLRAAGEDLASVPLHCRTQVPFPVDVSPKFSLIEDMRQRVLQMGRRPLIVLHQRHIASPHEANAAVLKQWEAAQALLPSPGFLNDDYCWLYAAVARPGSLIVSNDQMRDHHFSILSPRFFMRWRQRHRITYAALYHSPSGTTVLRLHPPRPYSVWVQRCLTSGGKSHWHLPYMASIAILEQATNKTTTSEHDVDLAKNGDDECSNWLCTSK